MIGQSHSHLINCREVTLRSFDHKTVCISVLVRECSGEEMVELPEVIVILP